MHLALMLAVVVAAVVAVAGVSRRLSLPEPVVLVAVGASASFLPFVPEIRLTTGVVLVGFLPPLLYSAALQTSLVDFNANRRSILLLSIGLVVFTAVGVGLAVHQVIPGLDWPAAFALGAVVAPPDAVAATAIARRIGLPRRLVTILEGESLLNDATALVALRTAVLAAAGAVTALDVGVDFLLAAGGGVVAGVLTYLVIGWVRKQFVDPVLDTSVSFITPFLAYLAAEALHGSGVLAVVVAGLFLGHRAPVLQTASSRIAERLNWRTIAFLLESSVFLLIGLQARWILQGVVTSGVSLRVVVVSCLVTLVAVIVLRMAWVFGVRGLLSASRSETTRPPWTYTAVLGWAGMRGVVTLAAAFAIPVAFPQRSLLVLIALVVTAGTLFLQGLTLPWVVRRLRVPAPDPREDALARAALFQKASAAGLDALHDSDEADPHDVLEALRRRAEERDFAAWERLGNDDPDGETPSEAYARRRLEMLEAERRKVLEVRGTGNLPSDVVEDVLAALDVEESMLDAGSRRRERLRQAQRTPVKGPARAAPCSHLAAADGQVAPNVEGVCEDCVVEGTTWVHLRYCLACGHVGCCDSSPRRHATAHFHETDHPVMQSAEPDETWRWCYVDHRVG
ncbi:MAG TPA: Na+/H+ antiporter [Nocardioidaceae bacterium]|nr:Na+/H+ antiporter [Nocardioidaceae bacterium]